jgi:hypothetical protein
MYRIHLHSNTIHSSILVVELMVLDLMVLELKCKFHLSAFSYFLYKCSIKVCHWNSNSNQSTLLDMEYKMLG